MALFQKSSALKQGERRAVQRYTVDCAAKLKMPGGDRKGRLSDLSEAGARFDTQDPPQKGVSGLLAWGDHEFFGKIAWANENSCGMIFERPIPTSIVESTCEIVEVQAGPVANFGNIPVAKRGRRASIVSRDS